MNDNDPTPRGRRWKLGMAVLLLLFLGVGWYCWPDGRVNTAKRLRDELSGEKGKALTSEQRQQKWRQLRQTMEKMTPAQREVLRAEDRKRRTAELGKYFSLSPAEKARYLDERIKRMNQMSQGRAVGPGSANRGPAGGQNNRGGTGAGSPTGGRSTAARDGRRQDRLDGSTPAERAMLAQYMSDLSARRRQLGLPAMGGPRR